MTGHFSPDLLKEGCSDVPRHGNRFVNEYTQLEFKLKLLSFLKDSIIQRNNCAKFCKYAFALLTIVQVLLQIRQTK